MSKARRSGEDSSYAWLVAGTLAVTVTVSYGVLTYTFGIVLVTLLVQGSTAGWVVRRVGPADQPASTLRTT